ncbi:MAG: trigger factor [Clostridia bacterium]|nr:trigger factor [Clostridia bacterium]
MNFRKTLLIIFALVMILALSSCQLSEYIGKDTDTDTDTGAASDTSADTSADTAPTLESYIPEGVDIEYTIDYMNEDLTAYVTLGEYKGLSVEVATYEINDDYINEKINELLEAEAVPSQITDRKTAEGDTICVDYVGTLDGVAFQGGSAQNVSIILSENSGYIPGFTDGMYDVMPGETVSYNVTFPDEYKNSPDLAGQETVFTVTVHYIEGDPVAPELTDEFVKDHFGSEGCETVDSFMTYYKGYLEQERANSVKEEASADLWALIMEDVTAIEIPEKAVEALYWSSRANYELYAYEYGIEYEEFLSMYVGMDDESLREYAENYIKEDIVIYSIVKAEGLEVTDEELAEGIATYCEEYDMTEEELIEAYSEERIIGVLQWNKLMAAIYDWSTVTEIVE